MSWLNYLSPGAANPMFFTHHYPFNSADKNDDYERRKAATLAKYKGSIFGFPQGEEGGILAGSQKSLLDLLNNPGQTDSALFNQSLAANSRSTDQRLDASRGTFARSGLGSSGLAMAFQQAIKGAGANNASRLTAEEARRKEDLRRADLKMLYDFIINPEVQKYGADRGVSIGQAANKAQETSAGIGAAGTLIGSLASSFCHTADELYGYASEKAILSRYYMAKYADDETRDLYNEHSSKRLSERVRKDPRLRAEVKPIFDHFVEVAKGDFERYR